MKLLQNILEADPAIKHFNILTFNVGAAWVEPKGVAAQHRGRPRARRSTSSTAWCWKARPTCPPPWTSWPARLRRRRKATPLDCFLLSDGHITWGETGRGGAGGPLRAALPVPTRFHCYRTGLGAENLELFEALTRKGGGVFNCFGEADLPAAAQAHRTQCLHVDQRPLRRRSGDVRRAGRRPAGRRLSRRRAGRRRPGSRPPAGRRSSSRARSSGEKVAFAGVPRRSPRRRRAGRPRLGARWPWRRCWRSTTRSSTDW